MHRFFAWGCQEPSLLCCPAEAASPPSLSSFQRSSSSPSATISSSSSSFSSSSSNSTLLPSPLPLCVTAANSFLEADSAVVSASAKLFTNIERQLSAKLGFVEPLLLASGGARGGEEGAVTTTTTEFTCPTSNTDKQQVSPPPLSSGYIETSTTATIFQHVKGGGAELSEDLEAAVTQRRGSFLAPGQRDSLEAHLPSASTSSSSQTHQQKGLDAFFAALTSASEGAGGGESGGGGNSEVKGKYSQQKSPASYAQGQFSCAASSVPPLIVFAPGIQTGSSTHESAPNSSAASIIEVAGSRLGSCSSTAATAATIDSFLSPQPQQQQQQQEQQKKQQTQQLAESIQAAAVASKAIANAVTAVNFMNAAIAVQQQQNAAKQQQQQQQLAALQLVAHSAATSLQQQQQQVSPLSPAQGLNVQVGALLNRLTAPNILRSPTGPSQSKPIPLLEDKFDLMEFKKREPREWTSDAVIAWILDVARRHQIPCEKLNLTKFASCNGPLLMLMNEQSFKELDPIYGSLLFGEFCKLVTDENFIDEWMRTSAPGPSFSGNAVPRAQSSPRHAQPTSLHPHHHQQQPLSTAAAASSNSSSSSSMVSNLLVANLALQKLAGPPQPPPPMATATHSTDAGSIMAGQQQQQRSFLLAAAAGLAAAQQQQQRAPPAALSLGGQLLSPTAGTSSTFLALHHRQQQQQHQPGASSVLAPVPLHRSLPPQPQQIAASHSHMFLRQPSSSSHPQFEGAGTSAMRPPPLHGKLAEQKIRRNKDGRPRKRSQHTKGNKLWEFIRDALKDPRTCPSIVRWEDPSEGVFRIVESERLAYLWGQKKNNRKMTYEKLSRAMRTYYEKEILVPVPKSGLYPKKLVYKFGPSAMGWKVAASLAVQSHLAMPGPAEIHAHHHLPSLHHM